jgi:hypothetical protein
LVEFARQHLDAVEVRLRPHPVADQRHEVTALDQIPDADGVGDCIEGAVEANFVGAFGRSRDADVDGFAIARDLAGLVNRRVARGYGVVRLVRHDERGAAETGQEIGNTAVVEGLHRGDADAVHRRGAAVAFLDADHLGRVYALIFVDGLLDELVAMRENQDLVFWPEPQGFGEVGEDDRLAATRGYGDDQAAGASTTEVRDGAEGVALVVAQDYGHGGICFLRPMAGAIFPTLPSASRLCQCPLATTYATTSFLRMR